MRTTTYRALQGMAGAMALASSLTFAQTITTPAASSLAGALMQVGLSDWLAVALVSLSFGMVSLLQRFKRSEAGQEYGLFVAAHISGSFISGVIVYLLTQGFIDAPNRFAQALAIGAAGWGGSAIADAIAAKVNRQMIEKA